MLLYQFRKGTNPRRVIIYLAEKGIDVPRYELDYANGEHRSARYVNINPAGRAPILVTDSGLAITESAAIVEYLEELYPDRPMIGSDPLSRARVRSLERLGNDLIARGQLWLWNRTDAFPAKEPVPSQEMADRTHRYVSELLDVLEKEIGENAFLGRELINAE
ncbi:glutathione S-transferase N-terminal domain-containing protein [Mesorhizobium sp. M0622]|uniref:glutathione S-transferase N-terminal domain-containing protein n=1 Tax=Mesorhizobium sp. M0622 TaxID=2956975 RepID=UPI0033397995